MHQTPSPSDALRARRRSVDNDDVTPLASLRQPTQTTYFLADETSRDASTVRPTSISHRPKIPSRRGHLGAGFHTARPSNPSNILSERGADRDIEDVNSRMGTHKEDMEYSLLRCNSFYQSHPASPATLVTSMSTTDMTTSISALPELSRPVTPSYMDSPSLASTIGSPSSRGYDSSSEDAMSQAILSGEEDEVQELSQTPAASSSIASQFVMPSLSMPRRKPLTEKGKSLGRLKILLAGAAGTGKTSLIKAISQSCEDIIHVDESNPASLTVSEIKTRRLGCNSKYKRSPTSTCTITENYASTRAYPPWWSEIEEGRVLRRRKSTGEPVLERNICFVDTPGYGNDLSFSESAGVVLDYVEKHLAGSSRVNMLDEEVINMMSGDGGSQVDVVFYLIHQRLQASDVEFMKMLAPFVNIIPILVKTEDSTPEQIQSQRANVLSQLQDASIKPFLFGQTLESAIESSSVSPPFAISTLIGSDHENMDASLLMSPDYVSPLIPSQLSSLVEQVFDRDSISWLRHSTAKKVVQHQSRNATNDERPPTANRSLTGSTFALASTSFSHVVRPPLGTTDVYTMAKIADHARREEILAQITLSKWSAELQRSLHNERARYETLARGERADWLVERFNETIHDGAIVPRTSNDTRSPHQLTSPQSHIRSKIRGKRSSRSGSATWAGGKVGRTSITELNEEMWRRTLAILGGFGVLGGVAWWFSRGGLGDLGGLLEIGREHGEGPGSFTGDWLKLVGDW